MKLPAALLKTAKWTGIVLAALLALIILFLLIFDWNMLRGPIARAASKATGREVAINGDLDVRLLTFTPNVTVNGLTIGNPNWLEGKDKENMADIGRASVAVRLWPLFKGDVVLPWFTLASSTVALERQTSGRANWTFGDKKTEAASPFELPVIEQLLLENSRLSYRDAKLRLNLDAAVSSSEKISPTAPGTSPHQPFQLEGKGTLNGAPFRADIRGGSLLALAANINTSESTAYPFHADVQAGSTRIQARGQLPDATDLSRLTATLTVQGPDLADLYVLTGVTLPNTPPYKLSGALERVNDVYNIRPFSGTVGASDLSGNLTIDAGRARMYLKAELQSKKLDFADLGALVGAPQTSRVVAGQARTARRLLPDAPLQAERVRNMDADVTYRAASILAPGIPLEEVRLDLAMKHGVLKLDPVTFRFPQGQLWATVSIDANPEVPEVALDARLRDIRPETFFKEAATGELKANPPITGLVLARAQLTGRGDSVRKAAASANGQVTLIMPHGEVRQAFAELVGVNVARGLGLFLTGNQQPTQIRCGVAQFRATNGQLKAETLLVDTGVVRIGGEGGLNLQNEQLDLTIRGEPKEARLLRLVAPIRIEGPLSGPGIGVNVGPVIAQGVGAVALSALSPLAAILPFVDAGLAEDANCRALMQNARSKGGTPASRVAR